MKKVKQQLREFFRTLSRYIREIYRFLTPYKVFPEFAQRLQRHSIQTVFVTLPSKRINMIARTVDHTFIYFSEKQAPQSFRRSQQTLAEYFDSLRRVAPGCTIKFMPNTNGWIVSLSAVLRSVQSRPYYQSQA